jgi:ABC-type Fe3+ transport system permease subunit
LDYICNKIMRNTKGVSDLFQEFLCFRSLLHYFLTAAAFFCVFGILFSFFSASSVRTYQRQHRLLLRIREVVSITTTHDRRGNGE